MATVTMGTKFPAELVTEMFSKVRGKSSIAKLVASEPIPFVGKDVFTFSLDNKISVVAEGAAKPAGAATVGTVQIRPVKVIYQSRVTAEFLKASEEKQLETLRAFAEGYATRIAEGFDEMCMHGVNPSAGTASAVIGNNHMDYVIANYSSGANKITWTSGTNNPDDKLEAAIAALDGEADCIILGPTIRTALAGMTVSSGEGRKYPDFAWGQVPPSLGGIAMDANKTVEVNSSKDRAFVFNGEALKWGFAEDVTFEVIEYGNPDGGTYDLKQANEVLLRSEAFIGWGFLDNSQFASVVAP